VIDSLDLDADNDGILDILEAGGVDSNGDGRVDDPTDSDQDGLADSVDANVDQADLPEDLSSGLEATQLPVIDTDGDLIRDFQDVDSDSDGLSDLFEGGLNPSEVDTNNDGVIDRWGY